MITESKIIYNFEFMKQYGVDISGGVPDNATAMEEICRRAYNKGWMDCRATMDVPDTNVGEWIPCSERLPEDSKTKLVTLSNGLVEGGYYSNDAWWCIGDYINLETLTDEVVTWMPLPEPYKEDKE